MPFDVSFACTDWEDKLRRGETPIADLPLNEKRATQAVNIFNSLRLPDVPGKPPLAEAGGEWFRDIVRAAFAAEDPETGLPLVNEVFTLVPKKNAKTTYSAALGLTALMLWDRPNAQMLILGPTQAIAERCFQQAQGMIKANERLAKIFHVQEHLKKITRVRTGATLTVKTFDMAVVTGEIPALTIVDELHVLGAKHGAERVIAQITGGMVTNPGALLVYITTQSDTPPQGVFKTKLDYARRVRDGEITGAVNFLPVLYEFPEHMQIDKGKPWLDPATWALVTPNLGLSVNAGVLRKNYEKAKEEGPESVIVWASQHLNIQIGMGLHSDGWPGALYWADAAQPGLTLEAILDSSDVCTIGFDGGGLDDLAAIAVIGRHAETRDWQVWVRAWAHPDVFERRKKIATQLRDFERDGDLVVCTEVDQDMIEAADICERIHDRGLLPEAAGIGLDAFGVATLVDALEARDLGGDLLLSVGQGWKLQAAVLTLPRKIKDRTLLHGAQPLAAWAVGNAKVELKGSNYMVTKQAAGAAKIDPLMAIFNAAMLMFNNPMAVGQTVYRARGALVI